VGVSGTIPPMYHVTVYPNIEAKLLDQRTFDYSVPPDLWPAVADKTLALGSIVRVPFGRQPSVIAYVVGVNPAEAPTTAKGKPYALKPISKLVSARPVFTPEQLSLWTWLADQTATPLAQVISCALPAALLKPNAGVSRPRKSKKSTDLGPSKHFTLNTAQQTAVDRVLANDDPPETAHQPYLLYGVTGSGKTEVYLQLAEAVLARGQSVMILVPEIALTAQLAKRFAERFGPLLRQPDGQDGYTLWHSNLADGAKANAWFRMLSGEVRLVIGARSAIFTPLQHLGLIVLDEEHDGSYKQDSPAPRYHARTLALELARRGNVDLTPCSRRTLSLKGEGSRGTKTFLRTLPSPFKEKVPREWRMRSTSHPCKVVLGSATPDVSTYYFARQRNRILTLPARFGGRTMATVNLVDMREERQAKGSTAGVLSTGLKQAINDTLAKQEQVILLINRRGFFTLLMCQECETVFQCSQCTVSLTYHRAKNKVRCHYCGIENDVPQFCPVCASSDITKTGVGSQRVEDELILAFPEARILRLDGDVLQKRHAHTEIFAAFMAHEADILVGTQMVAKGLDIPNVTLVGVVGADASFTLPDYKSSERGFQLLTQVAGRAGRGEKPGQVLIQTMLPQHPIITNAQNQDYLTFYADELQSREASQFPPFSRLFRLMSSDEDETKAEQFMRAMVLNLTEAIQAEGLTAYMPVLGPAACVIARIQGRFRFHCLVKNRAGRRGHQLVTSFFKAVAPPGDIRFLLDVDAQTLL
jgi:primosomal protein N' (replication factor Y) (superfamily II helicase)